MVIQRAGTHTAPSLTVPRPSLALVALAAMLCCCRSSGRDGAANPACDRWVEIRAGEVTMGSVQNEPCRDPDEGQVKVKLDRGFSISACEVTQAAFEHAMAYNPSFLRDCPHCPVESVTYDEAAAFCNALSTHQQLEACYECQGREAATVCRERRQPVAACRGYRLPTEAEWEHAARAGTHTSVHTGWVGSCMRSCEVCNEIAWYKVNSTGRSHPVGKKAPNPWGIFDLHGNVYEWTADWYANPRTLSAPPENQRIRRVLRGGSWYHNAEHLRAANRLALKPGERLSYVGFRCVRSL